MFFNYKKSLYCSLISITIVFGAQTAYAIQDNVLSEQYYVSRVKNNNIGYYCTTTRLSEKDGIKTILTIKHSEHKFKRFGDDIKLTQDFEYVEDEQGNPISLNAKIQSAGQDTTLTARFVSAEKVVINSITNGIKEEREIKLNKKILFPYAVTNLLKNNDGKTLSYSTIDATADFRVITIQYEKISDESLTEDKMQGIYHKYKVVMDLLPNIENYEWYNSNGKLVKEFSSILNVENIISSKTSALGNYNESDISSQGLIPIDSTIERPQFIDQITYKIQSGSSELSDVFVNDDRQRIIQAKNNIAYLKIKNEQPKAFTKYKYPVNASKYSEFLKSGPFIKSSDPQIKDLALKLVNEEKGEKDAYKIAKKYEKWVYDNVETKTFSTNFTNALQVLKSSKGDCTEHAVLLASLLRAAGIPAKVVVGLTYVQNPQTAFSYHMWVKAYVGEWINLDPTCPSENFSPVHIAMYENSLNNLSDKTDLVVNLVKSFSSFKVNVLNYNFLETSVANVKIQKNQPPQPSEINFVSLLKNNDNFIKKLSLNTKNNCNIDDISLKDNSYDEFIQAGLTNFSNGNIKQAIDNFEKAANMISINDDFTEIQFATQMALLGLFSLADKKFDKVYDPQIWNRQIQKVKNLYYPSIVPTDENEIKSAIALSKINFESNPDSALAILKTVKNSDYKEYLLYQAYKVKNDNTKALAHLNEALLINPNNLTYRSEKAKLLLNLKQYTKAEKEIEFLLGKKIPDKNFVENVITQNYLLKSKTNKNLTDYYLAKYNATSGEYRSAIDILNKTKTKNSRIYTLLGDINFKLENYDESQKNYNAALNLNKHDSKAITGLGNIQFNRGQYKKSLDLYKTALKYEKNNTVNIMLKIAENYKQLSQEETAYQYYKKILKINNMDYVANYNIGVMYKNFGEYDKALTYFKKALSENLLYTQAWLEIANINIKKKNNFIARTYLSPVYCLDKENPDYYYYMGLIDVNNEDYSEAKMNFSKAIDFNPNHEKAKLELENLN